MLLHVIVVLQSVNKAIWWPFHIFLFLMLAHSEVQYRLCEPLCKHMLAAMLLSVV